MNISFFYLFAYCLSLSWAYDKNDLICDGYCYYKGHPVLSDPTDIETHIKKDSDFFGSGFKYIVKKSSEEIKQDKLDIIVKQMDDEYKALMTAHPQFNYYDLDRYGNLPIYDEYGGKTSKRATILGNDWSRFDSRKTPLPINFKRWKKILDIFRREVTTEGVKARRYKYLGQNVTHEINAVNHTRENVRNPVWGHDFVTEITQQNINPEEFAADLEYIEQNMGKSLFTSFQNKKRYYDVVGSKWDPTDPTNYFDSEGNKSPLYDRYGRPVIKLSRQVVDSTKKPLTPEDIKALIEKPRHKLEKKSHIGLNSLVGRQYHVYRGVHLKAQNGVDIIEEEHKGVDGKQYYFKIRDGQSVSNDDFAKLLDSIDAGIDRPRAPNPQRNPSRVRTGRKSTDLEFDFMESISVESEEETEAEEPAVVVEPVAPVADGSSGNMAASISLGFLALSLLVAF